jgi:hypothetical protein
MGVIRKYTGVSKIDRCRINLTGAIPLRFVAGFPHLLQALLVFLLTTSSIILTYLSMD